MKNTQKLLVPLLETLGARSYVAPARWAARAAEEMTVVDNAHRAPSGVIEVPMNSVAATVEAVDPMTPGLSVMC